MRFEARPDVSCEFVALVSYLDAWEANRTRDLLERHDVQCAVQRGSRSVDPSGVHHRVVLQVWVQERDRERAITIVEAHRAAQRRLRRAQVSRGPWGDPRPSDAAEARARRAALCALTVGFGTGHLVAGARWRAAAFAGIDLLAVLWILASWDAALVFTPLVMRLLVMITDAVGGYLWAIEGEALSILER